MIPRDEVAAHVWVATSRGLSLTHPGLGLSEHRADAEGLLALVSHSRLPLIYGAASPGDGCSKLYVWRIVGGYPELLVELTLEGEIPCSIAIDQTNTVIACAFYTSGMVTLLPLDTGGIPLRGAAETYRLAGSSIDPVRQTAAHPHQVVFRGDRLLVPDLGSDLVRVFRLTTGPDPAHRATCLLELDRNIDLPAGSGPRHVVVLDDVRIAVSCELNETVAVLDLNRFLTVAIVPTTRRVGKAHTRSTRNYPGDIVALGSGRVAVANRGHDTIGIVEVRGRTVSLVTEQDSEVAWPQQLISHTGRLLVAGQESADLVEFAVSGSTLSIISRSATAGTPSSMILTPKGTL